MILIDDAASLFFIYNPWICIWYYLWYSFLNNLFFILTMFSSTRILLDFYRRSWGIAYLIFILDVSLPDVCCSIYQVRTCLMLSLCYTRCCYSLQSRYSFHWVIRPFMLQIYVKVNRWLSAWIPHSLPHGNLIKSHRMSVYIIVYYVSLN